MSRIALVPLDERPVNTRYPQMIAAVAGAQVELPPLSVLGSGRAGADTGALAQWLRTDGAGCDGAVVCAETLCFGNLIRSRISETDGVAAVGRLSALDGLSRPGNPLFLFGLVTRIPNADDCVEEPLYWGKFGTRLHRLSQGLHKERLGVLDSDGADELARLKSEIPKEVVDDWLVRRLRNHVVNLSLLERLARGGVDLLLLTSDDTSTFGLGTWEKGWLEGWAGLLGASAGEKLLVHPGADEVGSALVARMLCGVRGRVPRICPIAAVEGGAEIVAPYEDRPVWQTVLGQIRACGAMVVEDPESADIVLGVLTPSPVRTEFREDFAESERVAREGAYRAHFAELARWARSGKRVALGDVAYPNGSDPLAIELLLTGATELSPGDLCAYGAWNTAGNTLGTTVAQAVCHWLGGGDPSAQDRFVAHRFLEDWGYQQVVRRDVRGQNTELWGRHDPDPADDGEVSDTASRIESGLARCLARLQSAGIGTGLGLVAGSVRLPWRRTFEVDFDLV